MSERLANMWPGAWAENCTDLVGMVDEAVAAGFVRCDRDSYQGRVGGIRFGGNPAEVLRVLLDAVVRGLHVALVKELEDLFLQRAKSPCPK